MKIIVKSLKYVFSLKLLFSRENIDLRRKYIFKDENRNLREKIWTEGIKLIFEKHRKNGLREKIEVLRNRENICLREKFEF